MVRMLEDMRLAILTINYKLIIMNKNINAQKDEQIGRSIFQELADQIGWQVQFTEEEFNPIDLHLTINKNEQTYTASGEIKNRAKSAIKYNTHIITLHKLRYLTKDNSDCAIFINIIGDDIFIYDCKKIVSMIKEGIIKPYEMRLPNQNVVGTGYHKELVVEVDRNMAIHFQKENNNWKLIK